MKNIEKNNINQNLIGYHRIDNKLYITTQNEMIPFIIHLSDTYAGYNYIYILKLAIEKMKLAITEIRIKELSKLSLHMYTLAIHIIKKFVTLNNIL